MNLDLAAKLRRTPGRLVTGAFILNSGLEMLGADDEHAKTVHAMAANAYPVTAEIEPKIFTKALAAGEIAVGSALLLPVAPAGLAGLALTTFASGLLGMWWRTPGMHREGSPRPTPEGIAVAKDVWMLGIGAGLMIDALVHRAGRKH